MKAISAVKRGSIFRRRGGSALFLACLLVLSAVSVIITGCGTAEPPDEDEATERETDFEDLPVLADLLSPVHPDETVEQTLQERFSLPNALHRLEQIREAGGEAIQGAELEMALANWTGALHGALLRQDYETARLQLELARCRYAAGDIGDGELAAAEERHTQALDDFVLFWGSFSIAD